MNESIRKLASLSIIVLFVAAVFAVATYAQNGGSILCRDYSTVNNSTIVNSTIVNSTIIDAIIDYSALTNSTIYNSTILNSTVDNSVISNSTISNSIIGDSTINDNKVVTETVDDNCTAAVASKSDGIGTLPVKNNTC